MELVVQVGFCLLSCCIFSPRPACLSRSRADWKCLEAQGGKGEVERRERSKKH